MTSTYLLGKETTSSARAVDLTCFQSQRDVSLVKICFQDALLATKMGQAAKSAPLGFIHKLGMMDFFHIQYVSPALSLTRNVCSAIPMNAKCAEKATGTHMPLAQVA